MEEGIRRSAQSRVPHIQQSIESFEKFGVDINDVAAQFVKRAKDRCDGNVREKTTAPEPIHPKMSRGLIGRAPQRGWRSDT